MGLLSALEGRVDAQNIEVIKVIKSEVAKSGQASKATIDSNAEHIHKLIDSVYQQSLNKTNALEENLATLFIETQKLCTERTIELGNSSQLNQEKAFSMIADLERKLESRHQVALSEQNRQHVRDMEETKEDAAKQVDNLSHQLTLLQHQLLELEKLATSRADEINRDTKREIATIIEERITNYHSSNSKEQSQNDYKKTLQMLLDLEKRLDDRQQDYLSILRQEFTKSVSQLPNSQ